MKKIMIRNRARSRGHLPSRSVLSLPAVLFAIGVLCALPAADVLSAASDQPPVPATSSAAPARKRVQYNQKEELYFERRYGIGQLRVHAVSAGASLEFRCLVLDAQKANALKDRRAAPLMVDRKTGKKLSVPAADGKPHQTATPEAGEEYWVVFGNRDKTVKPGNIVDAVIGTVHMSGLIVE
jgi:hypothetical protein